jgi:4-carboxymuconolactone decarboxylase
MTTPVTDRMPPLPLEAMSPAQRAAADELIAGPRRAVRGPFIPLMRSPELLTRIQKVGEVLRFHSVLPVRLSELATLVVARAWTQQFEWCVHVPLALQAGVTPETVEALRHGRRPLELPDDECRVIDLLQELLTHHGLSDTSYDAAVTAFGERGVVELLSLVGYFTMLSMILNVAHTPPDNNDVPLLPPLPA